MTLRLFLGGVEEGTHCPGNHYQAGCPVLWPLPKYLGSENPRGPECDILVTAGSHLQVSRARGGVTTA